MNKLIYWCFVWLVSFGFNKLSAEDCTHYVDPLIGSAGHGHVFVGASRPFGMMQLGPTNLLTGWDWCSGYNYSDSTIIGFTHTHLSGTGIGDLGDILFMPVSKDVPLFKGKITDMENGYLSTYSHTKEIVHPGYYSVVLNKYNIKAELTATERVGMHRYTYLNNGMHRLVIDLEEGIGPGFGDRVDTTLASSIHQIDSVTIEGYRFSRGWAKDEKLFFVTKFSHPFSFVKLQKDGNLIVARSADGKSIKAILDFGVSNQIVAKVSLSYVSCENARNNMNAELPGWNFEKTVNDASAAWNKVLGNISATFADMHQQRTFYTALYHTMIAPSIFSDVNGDYRGADGKVYTAKGWTAYTTFSLWDTYRASHPLFTLTAPERVSDFINSFIAIYKQQGRLPVWHLIGNETDCMVGYHAIPVIVDAYFKDIKGFDVEQAYEAMKSYENVNLRGLPFIKKYGYIPADLEIESVSSGLEFCIDDWCIAKMAKALGKTKDYAHFSKRSEGYSAYFDKKSLFMRAKLSNGTFKSGFDPSHYLHTADDYIEGNAWQYTWLVPQNVEGMIKLYDSPNQFISHLDNLFLASSNVAAGGSMDMTGMIGQYVHGNEPSHHIAYLYAFAGQQWKTAEKVRQVMRLFYNDTPSGLCGNEDCGQMSAWYIFSALGFYPVNPSNGVYVLGSPLVDRAEIQVPNGKTFVIKVKNNSKSNQYIQSATLNGKPYEKSYITHKDIKNGGFFELKMGSRPNKNFGTHIEQRPTSAIK